MTTYGGPTRSSAAASCSGVVADPVTGRRDAGVRHHLLGERLAALELRGGGGRAEDGEPGRAQLVGGAGDERRLRPDDDEVGGDGPGGLERRRPRR